MNLNESFWQISKKKKKERKKIESFKLDMPASAAAALAWAYTPCSHQHNVVDHSFLLAVPSVARRHVKDRVSKWRASSSSTSRLIFYEASHSFTPGSDCKTLVLKFFFPNLGLLRVLRWKRPLVVCWTLRSQGELALPKILEKKEEVPRWNPQCRTLGQDRWVPRRCGFINSLGFSCLRRNAFFEAATGTRTPPAKQRRVSTSRA